MSLDDMGTYGARDLEARGDLETEERAMLNTSYRILDRYPEGA